MWQVWFFCGGKAAGYFFLSAPGHCESLACLLLYTPLFRVPPPPPQRGRGRRLGCRGLCLGIERRGAWSLVCLGAPNESVIHGTRGSHRERIRGALSNCSLERVERYLICPPSRQLPLGSVCVPLWMCQKVVGRGGWKTPHETQKKEQSCCKTDQLYSRYIC